MTDWTAPTESPGIDSWLLAANRHLLGYIIGQARIGVHYCDKGEQDPQTQELVKVLVAYKNAWAGDMREWPNPTVAEQKKCWQECMARAEAQCAEIRKSYASPSTNPAPR